jgi:hypothetical protein
MSKFKVGDKIRCIDAIGTANLKAGKSYRVLVVPKIGSLVVLTEWGDGVYGVERFEKVLPNRKKS